MIPLKLGRRVSALFLSALLLSASVLPAFATSVSGQLPEVGWAETVSSFLMASGIYPFESDPETGYEEWSVSSLKALWDDFRADTTQVAYDIVDLTGSLVKGVIAIASGRWSVLREFVTWIVNKYNVTDNQTGVELGTDTRSLLNINRVTTLTVEGLTSQGTFSHHSDNYYGYDRYIGASTSNVFVGLYPQQSGSSVYNLFFASNSPADIYLNVKNSVASPTFVSHSLKWTNSYPFYYYDDPNFYYSYNGATSLPIFSDLASVVAAFQAGGSFSGVTADTTTISIPAPLPSGTEFGGLAVSGAGVAVTPEQLEEIVQDAVKEALKPSVAVVPVALSPDVSVNPSGEITVSGDVTIDSGNIPLQPSDYSAPNLSEVFPFSIPWDVLAVLNVLDAEPVRPEFSVDVYIPVLDVHVPWTIGVSETLQEPVDAFMASVRLMLLVAMCAATLWAFWRSHL